jgi:hypothetical protein
MRSLGRNSSPENLFQHDVRREAGLKVKNARNSLHRPAWREQELRAI